MRAHKTAMILASFLLLTSCDTNPATGQRQFTGLMPASQEASVGATEHEKAIAQYGVYGDQRVQSYVTSIGQKLAATSERTDVQWKYTVLDSPIINAFALPGGYVYVTRGLMAWANSEAELAAVMAHEIGHVNARHSAARYSSAAAAQIGLSVLGAIVNKPYLNQAAGLGANLALSQYSQSQEYEADSLGIRYLGKTGYDPLAMSNFLRQLARNDAFEQTFKGRASGGGLNQFFAGHPSTPARVQRSAQEGAAASATAKNENAVQYMQAISGLAYGEDVRKNGYIRGNEFIQPSMGFGFSVPNGFALQNGTNAVTAKHSNGTIMVFDAAQKQSTQSVRDYYMAWAQNAATDIQDTTINGMAATTGVIPNATMNGANVSVRTVAIQASPTAVYRFQYAIPPSMAANAALQSDIQTSVRSFRMLSESERQVTGGQRVMIVAAKAGDSVDTMAAKMAGGSTAENRALFMALNGMDTAQPLQTGRLYKLIQ